MAQAGSILIVDDELGPRESLRMILKPIYDVHTASNGQEALKFLQKEEIDLVTLDLKMPGLSGLETLKEIKRFKPEVEIIIITGYGTLTNAQEAIRYGAGDFISKPFNVADIIAIISKSFERRSYNLRIKTLFQKFNELKDTGGNKIEGAPGNWIACEQPVGSHGN
jgi:putative two-component system response regulator